ncbi:hypothetical protein JL722_2953 [Aureococcus anophagefferens]|nr:hypothetical protein JL722_2953 [Aureococcus anophagefferens]
MSAIPAVVAAERVPGGEANRIVGVVDALKYFDANEGGFGFLRRTGHPVANSREHHVHFRSKDAPEPFSDLKVAFTLVDRDGRPNAHDVVVTGPGDSAKVDGSKRKGSWTKEKKSPRSSWGEAKEKKQIPALSLGGSRPGASSAGAARSSRAESEGVPAVTDVSSSEATSSETSEYRSQRHRLATFGVGPAVAEAPQDGAGGAAREGDDGFASLDEQPGFFNPLAAKEARQWAAGARVYASMPGCAIADRPPGLPRDSVALRKSTDTWQGSFIMHADGRLAVGLPRARAAKRREPAAHAAVRGAHEVLALRFGVLDDDVGLVTVQPHARCAVVDAASRPDVVFLRVLAVDDGSSPKRKLRSSSSEFVPKHFVAPSPPNSPAGPAAATPRTRGRPRAQAAGPARRQRQGRHGQHGAGPVRALHAPAAPQRRAAADDDAPAPNSADKGGYKKGNKNGYKKDYSKDKPKRVFKNKKSIPCCYFLRNLCENGDSCKFSHDASLTGLDTGCSWGKDCRYGHYYDPYAKDACEPCDAAVTAE